jgi:amino acid transporter
MALRRELNVVEAAALSIAIMAPTAAMALNGSLAASLAGRAVPLAFLGALVTVAFVAYAFTTFSRRFATSGSVYAFAARGLGVRVGFLSGWVLLLTYLAFTIASAAEVGLFFQTFVGLLGGSVPWLLPSLAALAVILALGLRRVAISTQVTLVVEGISVALIVVTVVAIFVHLGPHSLDARPFVPHGVSTSNVALASVFGFLSFAGFEGAAVLGEETRNPTVAIPRAIWSAVFGVGIFYVVVVYAQTLGFGIGSAGVKAFASSTSPLVTLAGQYAGHDVAVLLAAGATVSAFASALGTAIGSSRLLFAFGRDRLLGGALGRTNASGAPGYAIGGAVGVGALGCIVLFAHGTSAANVFGDLGTIGVLALLLAYAVTQVAGIRLFARREWAGVRLLVPIVAIVLLGYTFYSNVLPVPPAPARYFPYGVLAWIVLGVLIAAARPGAVRDVTRALAEEGGAGPAETPAVAPGGGS